MLNKKYRIHSVVLSSMMIASLCAPCIGSNSTICRGNIVEAAEAVNMYVMSEYENSYISKINIEQIAVVKEQYRKLVETENNSLERYEKENKYLKTEKQSEERRYIAEYEKTQKEKSNIEKMEKQKEDEEKERLRIEEQEKIAMEASSYSIDPSKCKLKIENEDSDYSGTKISVTGDDRDILERLVMGEAGGQGFIGAALVAQCIRDTMIEDGDKTVESVRVRMKYTGSLDKEPTDTVKKAVKFIFDDGEYVVRHRIIYFYAPKLVDSEFHESQTFVVEYGGHRFFDRNR